MKKTIRAALVAAMFSTTAVIALVPAPAAAQSAPKLSSAVQKKLVDASKLADQGKLDEALAAMTEANALPDLNETDKYQINKMIGVIAFKKNDFATAETAFDAAARSPAMPAEDRQSILRSAAGFASQSNHFDNVIAYASLGEAAGMNDPQLYNAAAQAYLLKDDYANAQTQAEKAVAAEKAAGQNPSHDTLLLLSQAQAGRSDSAGAQNTLEQMALLYGSSEDWGYAISQAIGTTGMNDLYVVHLGRLMYATNGKTAASDYKLFGDSANRIGFLGDAVMALDHGADGLPANLRTKATTDKNGLAAAETEAAKQKNGNLDIANAESYYGYGDYAKAEAAARAGIAKGGLKDPNEAQLVLGESLVAQGHYSDAIPAFKSINSANAAATKTAYLWAGYAQQKLNQVSAPAPAAQPAAQ